MGPKVEGEEVEEGGVLEVCKFVWAEGQKKCVDKKWEGAAGEGAGVRKLVVGKVRMIE